MVVVQAGEQRAIHEHRRGLRRRSIRGDDRPALVQQQRPEDLQRLAAERGISEDDVDPESLQALKTLMLTHRDMIHATFNAVAENYGTWHNLRREALGVSDDQLEVFKSYVLTEK